MKGPIGSLNVLKGPFMALSPGQVERLPGPDRGPVGTSVTITGNNLAGVTRVRFNGVNASFTLFGTSITAMVPQSATTTSSNAGFPAVSVRQGQAFLVQISASSSGLPDGTPVLPGNLILTVTLTK